MGLFGKSQQTSPKEQVQQWTSKLRKEGYVLDRQIRAIQREEEKTKRLMKETAKKGDIEPCRVLAKEIIRSKKAISKIHSAKAQLNSVQMSMKQQLATLRLAGSLDKSTQVMQSMQALIKMPEIQETMRNMSREMMKAGIIEEMLEDTMEGFEDQDELEDEAQEEVDKVLFELTQGELGKAPHAVNDKLPPEVEIGATAAELQEDDDEDEMRARLEALRS